MRYAKAPVGELRWRAPVPIDLNSDEVPQQLSANTRATGCPGGPQPAEFSHMNFPLPTDEDCLILDVVVPSNPVSSKLPVMVQIHGGGKFLDLHETHILVCI
jgi:carboxylesterase type B